MNGKQSIDTKEWSNNSTESVINYQKLTHCNNARQKDIFSELADVMNEQYSIWLPKFFDSSINCIWHEKVTNL